MVIAGGVALASGSRGITIHDYRFGPWYGK